VARRRHRRLARSPRPHRPGSGDLATIESLLARGASLEADAGARINDQDDERTAALHCAVFASRPAEIHVYKDLSQPHDTYFVPRDQAPLVNLLIARGAKLDAVDGDANTALHEAAMMDARAAAELLVAAGANRAARNCDGKTAYELAKDRHNSVEAVLAPRP
jgi:ankyrin repeat protein